MTTFEDPTDQQLWQEAAEGSGTAFGVLFDRHARAVYNHCFRLTASWSAAEDHTQATFLQAWRKRHQMRLQRSSALPWLLAVATNVVRGERRSLRRRLALVARLGATEGPGHHVLADPADDVVARLDDERRMSAVLAALRRLPRAEGEAIALCVWSGIPYADAAAALGIAEASVRSRVSRGRARLAGLLAGGSGSPVGVVASTHHTQEDR
ncbi:MAG TPA: RNA polymerase sigma factor [Cryptosporangiaceae bacterium]|nr:RNA polymerase sigma factor [Cryptosporangiaceae bacterium]